MRVERKSLPQATSEESGCEYGNRINMANDQDDRHSALNTQLSTTHIGPTEKERRVSELFTRVAPRYDLVNALMSLGAHQAWRRWAARLAGLHRGDRVLDVCCGTGDLSRAVRDLVGDGGIVVGVDICPAMLDAAVRRTPGLVGRMVVARAEALPFRTGCAAAALTGFSLRNVSDVRRAISELARVVEPGGRVVILETSTPRYRFILPLWRFYVSRVVPRLAKLVGAPADAYKYFEQSVRGFKSRDELSADMAACGLVDVTTHDLALGAVCVHVGIKDAS